ncbi:MAG TPA: hypothetical protein VG742_04890, partial [Dongiaceae bacterium]|nr:hypothetical protein [Dongiaceae bacterium]
TAHLFALLADRDPAKAIEWIGALRGSDISPDIIAYARPHLFALLRFWEGPQAGDVIASYGSPREGALVLARAMLAAEVKSGARPRPSL